MTININDNSNLLIETKPIIKITKMLNIEGYIYVKVPYTITCDLTDIPPEKHDIVIKTLMTLSI